MFTRIHYDAYKNKISLWEIVDGKRKKIEVNPEYEYYIPDQNGTSDIKDIYGNPVIMHTSKTKEGMNSIADSGAMTCEISIPEDIKFLQKRYKNETFKAKMEDFNIATIDIEVQSDGKGFSKPEDAQQPINVISIHSSKTNQVYTFGLYEYTGKDPSVKHYHYCATEKILLENFIEFFRKMKFDIITGWNSRLFDMEYFINRCKHFFEYEENGNNLEIQKNISPVGVYIKKSKSAGYHVAGGGYTIGGIATLDGMDLYKNFVYKKTTSYSLQAIGMLVVGKGKKDYTGTIHTGWKDNWNEWVEYNIQDVLLCIEIENKKKHIELAINFCYEALIPFEKIFSSIWLITGYILKYIHERNIVLPDNKVEDKKEKFPGAYVMALAGFYKYLISFDVESMYPHMIMQYNISPETLVIDPPDPENYYKCPLSDEKIWETANGPLKMSGIYYRKDKKGILPLIVSDIFNDRKIFKIKKSISKNIEKGLSVKSFDQDIVQEVIKENESSQYYDSQQIIRKILINSMYGVLGNPFFKFFNINNAMAVTLSGQEIIKYLSNSLNTYMKKNWHNIAHRIFDINHTVEPLQKDIVVLIDTDSNFVCLEEVIEKLKLDIKTDDDFRKFTNTMDTKFFKPFFNKILKKYADDYGVEQMINFKREKTITQKFILAKKKYADEVIQNEEEIYDPPKILITGIEIVRTDTPSFCIKHIGKVVDQIFKVRGNDRQSVIDKLKNIHGDFIKQHPTQISIPTGISDYDKYAMPTQYYIDKGLTYPKSCPIHVRAAMNYNYIIKKYNLGLEPVFNGTKMKYIYISSQNIINQNIIGFVGEWPKAYDSMFKVDYELQWQKTFTSVIDRFFEVLNWGETKIETNNLSDILEF